LTRFDLFLSFTLYFISKINNPRRQWEDGQLGRSITWFSTSKPVVFDILNSVMMNLKYNPFSGKETEDCNAYLKHFLDACSTNQSSWGVRIRQTTQVVLIFSKWKGKGLARCFTKRFNRDLGSAQEGVLGQVFPNCKILGAEEGDFQLQATRRGSLI